MQLRVRGRKMVICSLYAPHSGKPLEERQTFLQTAAGWMNSLSRHGPLLALGGFNAQLHKMHACESHLIGPHIFGNKNAHFNAESNRSLLLEMRESRIPEVVCCKHWFRRVCGKTSRRVQCRLVARSGFQFNKFWSN